MAKQLNVNLAFSADTSKVKAQLQDLQNQLNKLTLSSKTELGITKDIEDASRAAAELSVHLKNATNQQTGTLDFSKLNQSIKQSGTSLQQYGRTLQSLGPQGQQAFMSLAQAVANSEVPIRRTNAMLKEMGTTLANTARWQLSSSMLHGFMGAVQSAYGYAQDLNESLNNIRIVTGQNIDQMAKFAEEANKAARALSTTTTEYTNASLIYYQQGLNDQQVKERTDITIKMANVARQSAEVVSDQMTAVWNNFYDGSKSLEYYADVMTALGAATASSTDEISEGLNKFAAVANTVGLSYEYAASALATVTATTRQSADVVGTAFKTLFARIQDLELGKTLDDGTTLGSYSQALAKVGVQIKDTSGEMKSMDTILEEMAAKWDTLGKAEQIALAQSVAGVRQYTQLIALMDNWDFMEQNLATSNASSGALQKQADIYAESWEAAADRVTAAAENIYKALINDEFFIDLLNGVEKVITFVDYLIDNLGGLKGVLTAIGAIVTKVFANQISQGLTNITYNLKMMTEKGRQAEKDARKKFIDDAVDSIPQNKEYTTDVEKAQQNSMRSQLTLQQQYMENVDKMNGVEAEVNKKLMDRVRLLQEATVAAEQRKEKAHQAAGDLVYDIETDIYDYNKRHAGDQNYVPVQWSKKVTDKKTGQITDIGVQGEIDTIKNASKIQADVGSAVTKVLADIKTQATTTKQNIEDFKKQIVSIPGIPDPVKKSFADLNEASTVEDVEAAMEELNREMDLLIKNSAGNIKDVVSPETAKKVDQLTVALREKAKAQVESAEAADSARRAEEKAAEGIANATGKQRQWADILVESANLAFSAASALQMLGGAFEQLRDPDVSGWQKFLTVLTTLGMIVPTVISLFSTFKKILSTETVAKIANVAATVAQIAAEKKYNKEKGISSKTTEENTRATWADTKQKLKNTWNKSALEKETGGKITQNKDGTYNIKGWEGSVSQAKYGELSGQAGAKAFSGLKTMLGGIGLITAGVMVAVGAVKWGIAQFNKYSDAAKEAAEQAQQAATAYQAVSDSYNTFTSNLSAYQDAQSGLKDMTKGTLEYREAVLKANESAMQLLDTYENLEYTIDADGLIVIDETSLEKAREAQLESLEHAQRSKQLADQNAKNKELKAKSVEFQREELNSSQGTWLQVGNAAAATAAGAGSGALIGAGIGALGGPIGAAIGAGIGAIAGAITGVVGSVAAGAAANEEEEAINRLAEVYATVGNAQFATDEAFRDLLENELKIDDKALVDSLVANRESTLELVKEVSANTKAINAQNAGVVKDYYSEQLADSGLSEEAQSAISSRVGASLDEKTEELYNIIYKDKLGGKTDAEIQKAYAEAMGWATDTIDNQSGNKAKYFTKDGAEVGVVSDKVARRYLAEQEALKKLGNATTDLITKFKSLANSTDQYDKALLSYLTDDNFSNLNESEYDSLYQMIAGKTGDVGELSLDDVKQYLNAELNNGQALSDEDVKIYGDFANAEAFYKDFFDKLSSFSTQRENINSDMFNYSRFIIRDTLDSNIVSNMSNIELQAMGQQINRAYAYGGEQGAQYIADFFNGAGSEADKIANAFASIDWSTTSADALSETLINFGVQAKYSNSELNTLISYMSYEAVASIAEYEKAINSLSSVMGLEQGAILDNEIYKELPETLQSYFVTMSDGTQKLTADALDFYQAVNNAQKQEFQRTKEQYQQQLAKIQSLQIKPLDYYQQRVGPQELWDYAYNIPTTWDEYFLQFQKKYGVTENLGVWRQAYATESGDNLILGSGLDQTTGTSTFEVKNKNNEVIDSGTYYWDKSVWEKKYGNNRQNFLNNANPVSSESDKIIVNDQLELLRASNWGVTEDGVMKIAEWQDRLNTGYLTLQDILDISGKIDTEGESGYKGLLNRQNTMTEELQQLQDAYALSLTSLKERELALKNNEINMIAYNKAAEAAINQERWEGLDVAQVGEYAEYLENAFDMSEEGAEEAARVIMKMNKGIESLSNSFEDWSDILEKSSEDSYEYFEAMHGIKTSLSDILDVSEEFISNDFVKTHMEDIEKAAKGDEKAIDDLKKALADQIILDIFEVDSLDQLSINLQSKITTLKDWIDKNPLKIGATIDTASMSTDEAAFLQSCQEVIAAAGMTAEQANAYFSQMGYSTEFETEPQLVKQTGYETITQSEPMEERTVNTPDGGTITYPSGTVTKTFQGAPYEYDAYVDAIKMQTVTVDGKKTQVPKIKSISKSPTGSFNNFSSSNSGGKSSGSGSKPKKADKVKKSDAVERYKEINDQMEKLADATNDASKAADRLYGASRLKQMQKQNDLIQDEIDLLKQKKEQALQYLEEDRQAVADAAKEAGVMLTFDENGLITNYTEAMTEIYEELDDAINSANADGNVSESEQEKIDLIQERADNLQSAIDQYDGTRVEIDDLDNQLDDKFYEWQDSNAEMLSYKLELKLELNNMELEEIEYQLGKIEDDFYSMAEAVALMSSSDGKSQLNVYTQELADYAAQQKALEDAYVAGEISQAAYVEGLKEVRSGMYENLQALQELDKFMMEYYGNTLDMAAEEIAKYTDRMEHQTAVLDHYSSLLEIMGKSNDYKSMGKVLEGQAKTLEDQAAVAKEIMEMYQGQAADRLAEYQKALASGDEAAAELYLQQYEAALNAANEAEDAYLSKAEEWAEALKAVLENKLAEAGADLEKALTGGVSFDTLTTQMERANSLQEEYLTTTNKIYETNKMINTAQQAIDKTTNTVAKQKLKSFQEETAQLQNQGKLSQYELEIQQAKYDLLLAEIALEEAQQAKSTVRLQRDSEGNFGYVYTADASQVSDAEQKIADAQNALYNKGLEGANDYTQKYQETMQEMYDTLTDIQNKYLEGGFASEEEYHRAMEEAKEYYYQKLQDYSSLYQVALTTDSRVIADAWSTDFADMTYNTDDWMIAVNGYVETVSGAFDEWSSQMNIIAQDIGTDLDSLEGNIKDIAAESENLKNVLNGEDGVIAAIDAEATAVAKVTSNYSLLRTSLQETMRQYDELGKKITESMKQQQDAIIAAQNAMISYANAAGSVGGTGSVYNVMGGPSSNNNFTSGWDGNTKDFETPSNEPRKITISLFASPGGGWMGDYELTEGRFSVSDKRDGGTGKPGSSYNDYYLTNEDGLDGYITNKTCKELVDLGYISKKKSYTFDTGGYTGEWGQEGKWAMLHEKELILNADDTTNFLASLEVLREIVNTINLHSLSAQLGGLLSSPGYINTDNSQMLEQQVHIEASFPGVTERSEIEEAFNNLINRASQYVNRK